MIPYLKRHWLLILAAVVAAALGAPRAVAAQAQILCVDANATAPGSGDCWADPYPSLQAALDVAQPGDEIWVAAGIYTPGSQVADSFRVPPGVALYGGFAGTESSRSQRNLAVQVTVLSGDIEFDDITTSSGVVTNTTGIIGSNSYHVLTLDARDGLIDANTRLDGFTITAGSATDLQESAGGGLLCLASAGGSCSPTLTNLVFSGNRARFGAGMVVSASAGIARPALSNLLFSGNAASESGGALYSLGANGGDASPTLVNVTLSGNTAAVNGGALYSAANLGASSPALTNTILWDNSAPNGVQLYNVGALPAINYSLVQGGDSGIGGSSGTNAFSTGTGNIDANPLFANAAASDYLLLAASPAIDAGTLSGAPVTDLRGLPRPVDVLPDLGAYESQGLQMALSGDGQAVNVGGVFAQPLRVTLDGMSAPDGSGTVITFTPPITGPGLTVATPFTMVTDASGVVSATVTANNLWGSYVVTVTARGVPAPMFFRLTNGCPAGIAYVNGAATGSERGDSWPDAYSNLHEAIRLATACQTFAEIWVAQGVYTPGITVGSTFTAPAGVALYGGFAGAETLLTQRNWQANLTVLSGDIDGNDSKDASGVITTTKNIRGANAYHVVWVDGVTQPVTATTRLDGFVITGGSATGAASLARQGGGLYCNGQNRGKVCSPTIVNVIFSGNQAASSGGAMYNNGRLSGVSSPTLANVTFRGNAATGSGGAMYNNALAGVSSPIISNTVFFGNSASKNGGAIYSNALSGTSSPTIMASSFISNAASSSGGAIYSNGLAGVGSPVLNQVVMRDNRALYGGAIYNYGYSGKTLPVLTNVAISGSSARRGGAIYNNGEVNGMSSPTLINVTLSNNQATDQGGAIYSSGDGGASLITTTNTILWGNSAPSGAQFYNKNALPVINYSLVQGGASGIGGNNGLSAFSTGVGNVDADPLLADGAGGNLLLRPGSAAIDAGTASGAPAVDLRNVARPKLLQTDIGAYEAQGFDLAVAGGNAQTSYVSSTFALPLAVQVTSSNGEPTGPGGSLDFTPPASGPGLDATAPFTVSTAAGGLATTSVAANGRAGTFTLTVTARGVTTPAVFTLTNQYTINISALVYPVTGGVVSGGGRFAFGDLVTMTATASAGYVFVSWSDNGVLLSTAPIYTFPATVSRQLIAHFSPLQPVQVSVSADPAAAGVVSGGGWVNQGTVITATATANDGYTFVNWTEGGAVVSTAAVYSFTAAGDRALVAHFAAVAAPVTVSVSAEPAAGGVASGGGVVSAGSAVTVTAAANAFYAFANWTEGGAIVSTAAVYSFTAAGDRALVAHFTPVGQDPRWIGVSAQPEQGGVVSGGGWVGYGETATVTAAANPLYTFVNWTEGGTVVSTEAVYSFPATADRILVAHFTAAGPDTRTVTVSANPTAGGVASGGGVLNYGAVITVTASANAGYAFVGWTEGGTPVSADPAYRFTVTADRVLVAEFVALPAPVTVSVSANPTAGGVASGGGVVNAGSAVTATAAANAGYVFAYWAEGGALVSAQPSYSFVATASRTLVAHFSPVAPAPVQVSVSADPLAGGVVSGGGWVNRGAVVTVTATTNTGYLFAGWSENGVVVSTNPLYRFPVNSDRALVAQFAAMAAPVTVSVRAEPAAGGVASGGGVVNAGDVVTVTAVANAGYAFANWSEGGSVVSDAPAYTFAAGADRALVAHFTLPTAEQHTIALSANPSSGGAVGGGGVFDHDAQVTVTALANPLYSFVNWMEGETVVSTDASYTFLATADRGLAANFTALGQNTRTVAVSASPAAGGRVSGGGVVNFGDAITVAAAAKRGYAFSHWSENETTVATQANYSFVVINNHTLVAHFDPLPLAVNDAFGVAQGNGSALTVTANDRDPAGGGLALVGFSTPAHGEVAGAGGGSVIYTPTAGYTGLDTFTYTVQDANGHRDDALVIVFVADLLGGQGLPQIYPVVDPAAATGATFSASGATLQVQLPGGFYTAALTTKDLLFLVFAPHTAPSLQVGTPPAGLSFGGLAFDLAVMRNDQALAGAQFAQPVTLVITYDASLLGSLKPETLHLRYWTGGEWSDQGIVITNHDLANHTLTVVLPHLSQFALFAAPPGEEPNITSYLYLPVIGR